MRGWVLAMQGQGEVGMAQVHQGITAVQATGANRCSSRTCAPCWRTSAAHLGHTADGLQALAEAQTLVEQHEDRCWEAEVVASGASCSCGSQYRSQRRRKPGCGALWTSPAARRRRRWSCAPP